MESSTTAESVNDSSVPAVEAVSEPEPTNPNNNNNNNTSTNVTGASLNFFNLQENEFHLSRYYDRQGKLPAALQEHLDERDLQREQLDSGRKYICPNACPITPSAQHAPMSLTGMLAQGHASGFASHTGAAKAAKGGAVDDATAAIASGIAARQILRLQNVVEMFAQKQGAFMGWRRVSVLNADGETPQLFHEVHIDDPSRREQVERFLATNGSSVSVSALQEIQQQGVVERFPRNVDPFSAEPSPARSFSSSHSHGPLLLANAPRWNVRPRVLGAVPRNHQPLLPQFIPSRSLNDTFFLLATAAVATDKQRFQNLFASTSQELSDLGMVTCAFFTSSQSEETVSNASAPAGSLGFYGKRRERVLVTVDSLVPVTVKQGTRSPNDLELMFGRTNFSNDFWLFFLEKAYAAYRGGYSCLDSGDAVEVLEHLTGGDPRTVIWNGEEISAQSKNKLWWILQEATSLCEPMIAAKKEGYDLAAGAAGGSVVAVEDSSNVSNQTPAWFLTADQDPTLVHLVDPPLSGVTDWESGCVVLCAAEYDDSGELPVDPYERARGKRPIGSVHRLVKVRWVYPHLHKLSPVSKLQWGPNSKRWTALARKALGQIEELPCDDLCAWLTLDEFVDNFGLFVHVANTEPSQRLTVQTETTSAPSLAELVRFAPRFLISVKDVQEVQPEPPSVYRDSSLPVAESEESPSSPHSASGRSPKHAVGGAAAGHPPTWQFESIHDLEAPPIDYGEESEDDVGAEDASNQDDSRARSPSVSSIDSPTSAGKFLGALQVQLRVSVPHTERQKPLSIMLFRVLDGTAPLPSIQSVRDGAYRYSLPLQGRMQLTAEAQDPLTSVAIPESFTELVEQAKAKKSGPAPLHPQSAKSAVYTFNVPIAAGHYNVVVMPDTLKRVQAEVLEMDTLVQLTVFASGPSAERYQFDVHGFPPPSQ